MSKTNSIKVLFALTFAALISACSATDDAADKRLTVGLVQKEIKVGVSSIKVAQTLGSPNIVKKSPTSDGEVWIYDRISQTQSDASLGISVLGGGSDVAGLLGGSTSKSESSSRSLTVIIKLDEQDMVKEVSYFRSAY